MITSSILTLFFHVAKIKSSRTYRGMLEAEAKAEDKIFASRPACPGGQHHCNFWHTIEHTVIFDCLVLLSLL